MNRLPAKDGLVGLMVEPGPRLLVGLMGILKSGSGFVPLDPDLPPERLALMAEDCALEVLVTEAVHLSRAREVARRLPGLRHVVCLDAVPAEDEAGEGDVLVHTPEGPAGGARAAARRAPDPDAPVYVIYTSGSTGTPKGVPIHHRNLMPLLAWSGEAFGFGEQTRVLQSLSHGFDFGIFEILTTLLFGGTLVMLDRRERGDTELYLETVRRQEINTIHTTPSFFREVAAASRGELAGLEVLHLGGEALTEPFLEQAFAVVGERCVLYNGYGPTEATINCSLYRVGRRDDPRPRESTAVPIGRATARHHLVVLGAGGRLVPVGASGELAVGGVSVAQGYRGRPRLTAEKFVPDPFAERLGSAGGRLYLTGDLVRYRRDGQLEFVGRIDHQVKIRGFRIEPEEIAAVLLAHPGVREAAVIPRQGVDGNRRLVAYVVPAGAGAAGGLRPYLAERLPSYMVPAAFVELEALPLTPNGKLDRRALPEPPAQTSRSEGFVAPRGPLEELVAGVCSELLGLEEIGVEDDLFGLGCHSLIAMQIVARIRESLAVELPLVRLFEAPSVAGLAAAAEQASAATDAGRLPPVEPAPRDGEIPLSFSQERLWFLQQLDPRSAAYIVPRALALRGELHVAVLERAYSEIFRRHEILRTSFPDIGGRPVQVIHPPAPLAMPRVDLSALPRERHPALVDELILGEGQRPFDFERGPLIRLLLVRLAAAEHVLVQSEHHLVHDGWTQAVLARELLALYRAFLGHRPSPLPELPIQYADFAIWQRRWLRDEVLEHQLEFWRRKLSGAPPVLELPSDRPRPKVQTHRGEQIEFDLPAGLAGALRSLSRRQGATLFMTLAAAFEALIWRYTGRDDLVLGTGIANRRVREVESLIGMVINTLVLRTDLGGAPSFEELLGRARTVCLEAYAHQDLPFERLVEALKVPRSRGHAPIFQVLFAFMDAPMPVLELPGLLLDVLGFHNRSSKFDLNVVVIPHAEQRVGKVAAEDSGELTFHWEYASDLFDATTMRRMVRHFRALLASAVDTPGRRLSELPLLEAGERAQLAVEWNDTSSAYPRRSLTELFAERAALHPDAIAVKAADGEELTYGEMERRSHRLAHYLIELGVGPEVPVALCLERSAEMVVSILAVLEAGGFYVPLDPRHPRERQRFLLEETAAPLVLTDERRRTALPDLDGMSVVCLDRDAGAIAGRASSPPAIAAADPDRLAYVMYTSGSTGRPKGVAVPQAGVVRLVRETNYVRLGPGDRIGHLANPAFDASTYEIWGALLTGACVVVLPHETVIDPAAFAATLRREEVTSAFLTTALFNQMAVAFPDAFAGFRELLVGGDAVDPGAARQVLTAGGPGRLLNGYGPTESTTFAVWHWIRTVREGERMVPIGRPLANTRLHLVDRSFELVPAGVPGHLCLAGDGLARGYVGQGGRTAEKFVPNPFDGAGSRLYLTGDLARHRPDGVVEFLGRIDKQVKIRGFRVEPGEVEAVLSGLAAVREAAVVVRDDSPLGKRLVAYVVGTEPRLDFAALRAELGDLLPEYLLPKAFVELEALPLNANGKVDRAALPAPEPPPAEEGTELPKTPHEELVAGLWAEVLGLETVGRRDDFFEVGGHSLLATQVVSRLREAFGVELDLRRFFEARTVAGVAAEIQASGEKPAAPPLAPAPRDGELPLSFAQERMWVLHQLDPGSAVYNVPAATRLTGFLRPAALSASFSEILRRHETLRTTFTTVDGRPVQVIRPASVVGFGMVDLGAMTEKRREAESRRILSAEARRPFDLGGTEPLMRTLLLRLGAREHVALLTTHHVVSDGWSMGILVRELAALYRAAARGERSPFPELPVQYADFALWQRRWLAGQELERQLAYWRLQLDGLPLLELPGDRPRPVTPSLRGARLPIRLDSDLAESLRGLARREGATLFMALLAGYATLLGRLAGQRDVAVGSPIAGRGRMEIEDLIGLFVNTLVLRADLGGGPCFAEVLGRLRRSTLDAYAHQDVPFEKLVEALRPERHLAASPLFQVVFALQNAPFKTMELPDLELEGLVLDSGTAKFDLTLSLGEDPDGSLSGSLEFARDLFDATTVRRFAGHLDVLLRAAVAAPGTELAELSLLGRAGRQQLLAEWGAGAPGVGEAGLPVHRQVTERAAAAPDSPAVVAGDEIWTYGELVDRARRLAHRLRALGVGPETVVAVLTARSPSMVAGILAVLEAGGAYLPLDPAQPPTRLRFMIEDARVRVLLTEESLAADLAEVEGPRVLLLDDADAFPADAPSGALGIEVEDAHLAYVIYTSGSTGRPKGTELTHGGLKNLVAWHRRVYRPAPGERATLLAGSGFDASVWELWPTLASGAALHLPPSEVIPDAAALGAWLAAERITLSFLPTPLAESLLAEGAPPDLALRALLTGGDRLQRRPERSLPFELVNHYGPTESTVVATWTPVAPGVDRRSPPIGRPIDGLRIHVLDADLRPVPRGVAGELWIGGAGLARGYRRRPALTAVSFLPDPFGGVGERLYRSGDRVRFLADGQVDFLGRRDHQVKVRGFRVELGEIESALARRPTVREVAVEARSHPDGGRRLVAYVTAGDGFDAEAPRRELAAELPDYMVPTRVVLLEALPKSPSGKVDRRALPEPVWSASEELSTGPRSLTEEVVASLWCDVLGLESVGVDEDFFGRGGHSLAATRVNARVRQIFGVEVPLRAFFACPTVAALSREVESARGTPSAPPLARVSRQEPLVLSFAQERLWFLDRLDPEGSAYNVPVAVRLSGTLRPEALRASLDTIVRRHEALRTTFAVREEGPVQVIHSEVALEFPTVDLRRLAPGRRETEAQRLLSAAARRPFDLGLGPLVHALLLRTGDEEHLAFLMLHHIVSDGWSMGVLVREIAELYRAAVTDEPARLGELPIQYADFAAWQRAWLEGGELDRQLAYWRERLDGVSVLELPGDRPRPAVPSLRGTQVPVRFDAELVESLRSLGRSEGATLFMTLFAGYAVLLGRLAGQSDVSVGSPIAGRGRQETEDLIGFFVNTLVLRADLGGRPGFTGLLRRLRRSILDAYAHQDVPFEKLVEVLRPERHLAASPLFQVAFALQNAPFETLALPGLVLEGLALDSGTAKFDMTVVLSEDADGGLSGFLEFARDLFDATTARRFAACFDTLLRGAAAEPEARLDELPMLGPRERHHLICEWNDTLAGGPQTSLPALFAERVAAHPDAIAVVEAATGDRLTYRELAERARHLAHELVALGVGPEVPVGLCLERSLETIVAILAILEAGGSYVPLDPSYPQERLRFMTDDVRAPVVLTVDRFEDVLGELDGVRVVYLDREAERIAAREAAPLAARIGADNLAYVMYTSGSTGRPKGVAVCHGAVVRLVHETSYLDFGAEQVFLQFAPISFDAATLEIWGPLLNGGRLVIAPPGRISLEELGRVLARHGVTSLWLTAGLFHEMVEHHLEALRPVRQLLAGGDVLSPSHVRTVLEELPGTTLVNGYGPTENTTFTCCHEPGLSEAVDRPVPIGRPITNTRVRLLDPGLRPVPAGVAGQLAASGVGLARSYFRRPALTAERFVPDSEGHGERLYLTGDLARWRTDGAVEFLGRMDHQVKIRGFRVEPGEVETVLGSLAAVRAAAVAVRDDAVGKGKCLVGYVVPTGEDVRVGELTAELSRRLPSHMLPSTVVVLDELPLTPNGKVDRAALPAPERASSQTGPALPRTPAEELLVGIWREVLGVDAVGVEDDFFELGGHSLSATRVVSRVQQALGVEIPLRVLFAAPTVAALAREVELSRGSETAVGSPLERVDRDAAPLPLSFAQQRLWFLQQLAPDSWAYNVPQALRLRGALDAGALAGSLRATLARHEVLRTAFRVVEGEPVQRIDHEAGFDLALVDLSALDATGREAALAAVVDADSHRPFDLEEAPLLRGLLVRCDEAEHVLHLTLHHIASDGWSMGILMREVAEHYRAALVGERPKLPELPIQYSDYAVWQRQMLRDEVLERHLDYWRRQLGQEPPALELPRDRPLPEPPSDRGAGRPMPFGAELSRDLLALGRSVDTTPFMIVLAGLKAFLSAYATGDSLVVGTDVAGRTRVEVENLIGFFVNILPLHTDLGGEPTFRELLARVRETTLDGYAHQDLPFDKLVEELQPRRALGETPFFQVLFVFQNVPAGTFHLPGLELEALAAPATSSKFELMLVVRETDDGLDGTWVYRTELYDAATVDRLAESFRSVLALAVTDPDVPVRRLAESVRAPAPSWAPPRAHDVGQRRRRGIPLRAVPSNTETYADSPEPAERKGEKQMNTTTLSTKGLRGRRRASAVKLAETTLVTTRQLREDRKLPLVVEPIRDDVDLVEWAAAEKETLERQLLEHGGLLLRGFGVREPAVFERFAQVLVPELYDGYGDLPREELGEKIYHSTPYPPEKAILYHNESSQMPMWPRKQMFCCLQVAPEGGETPIVDGRLVYETLDPEIRRPFEEKGLLYVRNFVEGLDVSWQEFFHTEDRSEVEAYCEEVGLRAEWREDGGLRTKRWAPGVIVHPITGETAFFNQILAHHISCLEGEEQESLLEIFGEEGLPRNVYFGDGSPIPAETVATVEVTYRSLAVVFPWQQGDVVVVDNMLTSHSRNPFSGPRKVIVAMGEMVSAEKVLHPATRKP